MVYVCDNCGERFSRTDQPDHCPHCGTNLFHPANRVEQHEYLSQMAELIQRKISDKHHYPDAVMTEIFLSSCFSFKLPATAFQINDPMVVEISVDFGENSDRNELTGNVWVRQENGKVKEFLVSMYLPVRQGETPQEQVNRMFGALVGNKKIEMMLSNYVSTRLQCKD